MLNKISLSLALLGSAALFNANATIIGGMVTGGSAQSAGGTFVALTPPLSNPFGTPNSVGQNNFNSHNLYAFNEDQNVFVQDDPLFLNIGSLNPLPVGTEVASHYVFFDPAGTETQTGWVDFDSPIFGVITSTTLLDQSDYLANTGVNYENPTLRGLEPGEDTVWIDPLNPNRLMVDWRASSPGDYVRVLTQHSPGAVPDGGSTVVLLAAAIPAIAALRRKFQR